MNALFEPLLCIKCKTPFLTNYQLNKHQEVCLAYWDCCICQIRFVNTTPALISLHIAKNHRVSPRRGFFFIFCKLTTIGTKRQAEIPHEKYPVQDMVRNVDALDLFSFVDVNSEGEEVEEPSIGTNTIEEEIPPLIPYQTPTSLLWLQRLAFEPEIISGNML